VKKATAPVASTNEMIEIIFIFFPADLFYSNEIQKR